MARAKVKSSAKSKAKRNVRSKPKHAAKSKLVAFTPRPSRPKVATVPALSGVGSDRSTMKSSATELSWSEFDRQVQGLATAAQKRFKPEVVVGLVHGGVFVGGAIASALEVGFFAVRVSRRSRDSGQVHAEVSDQMPPEVKGRRVLLVDDVAASGDSLTMAVRLATNAKAGKIATAALVTRPGGFAPDFTAYTTSTFFVFPWDLAELTQDARFEPEQRR